LQSYGFPSLGSITIYRDGSVVKDLIDDLERRYTSNGWLPIRGGMDAMADAHSPEPVTPDTVRLRRPIGQIFVEFGFITAAQLDAALEVQRATGARIGEILVEQGSLDRLDLASALAEHWEPRNQEQDPGAAERPLLRGVAPAPSAERTSGAGGDAAIAELELRLRAAEDLLASRLEQPASVPLSGGEIDSAQQERVDDLALRLAALDGVEGTIDELRRSIEALAEVRLDGLAAAGVELHAEPDGTTALRARVEELEVEAARARTDAERAAAAWRNEVGSLAARIDELLGLRHADAQAARAASEQLGERLAELAALIPDGGGTASGPEAGPELRAELEQVASSVEVLGRRLDEQVAIGEEQARATERAVRKGLASLGKQLTGPEAKIGAEGKGLGRSIERLGAAVVEANARLADEVPVPAVDGCVAFAPTPTGYRLVEIPGPPPELGATVEVEGCESPVVVTRYGRSPLPFDRRPCAYLDRE
jgi:hypothetical protein